ncbi:MAG: type II secretion system F family protein [archaeon]|nr:type II secretion system F family protein [archaeon]
MQATESVKEFWQKKLFEFEEIIELNKNFFDLKDFAKKTLIISIAICITAILIGAIISNFYIMYFSFLAIPIWFLFSYFFELFRFEQKKKAKEKFIADALLQASSFPKGTSIIKIIKYLSETNYGLLSSEFKKCLNQINNGFSVEEALNEFKQRNKSKIISRAVDLMIESHKAGADSSDSFKIIANDLLQTQNIFSEREAVMLVQKYTILFAGAIIVPVILGLVAGMTAKMDFSFISELGLGTSELQRKQLFETALLANYLYIFEYALLASVFVALNENNSSKAVIYAVILVPLSLGAYFIAGLLF